MGLDQPHPMAGVGEFGVAISGGVWVAIRVVVLARLSNKTASVLLQALFCIEACCYSERLTGIGVLPWFVTIELVLGSLVVMSINSLTISTQEVGGDHFQELMNFDGSFIRQLAGFVAITHRAGIAVLGLLHGKRPCAARRCVGFAGGAKTSRYNFSSSRGKSFCAAQASSSAAIVVRTR